MWKRMPLEKEFAFELKRREAVSAQAKKAKQEISELCREQLIEFLKVELIALQKIIEKLKNKGLNLENAEKMIPSLGSISRTTEAGIQYHILQLVINRVSLEVLNESISPKLPKLPKI
jgi:hypothetical protein